MANRKTNGITFKGVVIDTAPSATGYWTDPVSASEHRVGALFLSFGNIGTTSVTLQQKTAGDPFWRNYKTFTSTDDPRQIIEDYSICEYRAGVASGNYGSRVVITIDFHNGESK